MTNTAPVMAIDQSFLANLDPEGRLNIASCLQCQRCSSGCTMRLETDLLPHRLNRMAALGMKDELLKSQHIWLCASCQTCVSRCPMKVDTPALIDKLREMAQEMASEADTQKIKIFDKAMLGSMQRFGRVYELGLMGEYKLRTRDFFSDLAKFPAMLRRGKMKLTPPMVGGRASVADIFKRVRARRAK